MQSSGGASSGDELPAPVFTFQRQKKGASDMPATRELTPTRGWPCATLPKAYSTETY